MEKERGKVKMTIKSRIINSFLLILMMFLGLFSGCNRKVENELKESELQAFYKTLTSEDVANENGIYYASSHILLTALKGTVYEDVENLVSGFGGEIVGYISATDDYQIYFSNVKTYEGLEELIGELEKTTFVDIVSLEYVAPYENSAVDYKNDPWVDDGQPSNESGSIWDEKNPAGNNWWAEAVNMHTVWNMNLETETVKVGIIDNMFDITHKDLDENLFAKLWNNPVDADGKCNVLQLYEMGVSDAEHGTSVASVIAAQAGNGVGITGINQNAQLYGYALYSVDPIATEELSWGSIFAFKCALAHMLNEDVKVINISMGFNDALIGTQNGNPDAVVFNTVNSRLLESFLLKYIEVGKEFLIVKAAGNHSTMENKYYAENDIFGAISNPLVAERILMVGAAGYNEICNCYYITSFSNIGDRVDVYAPGVAVLSDIPGNIAKLASGTSISTPIVSGVASLVWGVNPKLSAEQVKMIIEASTSVTMFDEEEASSFKYKLAEMEGTPTGIIDANTCVALTKTTVGSGSVSDAEYGTLCGLVYSVEKINREYTDVGEQSLFLYDVNGELISSVLLNALALGDENVRSYCELVKPGTYILEVKIPGYKSQSQKVTVNENDVIKTDFELMEFVDDTICVKPTYTERRYNEETGKFEDTEITAIYRIPHINIEGDTVKQINKKIYDSLSTVIDNAVSEIAEYGSPISSYEISYRWAVNEDILSLVIVNRSLPDDGGGDEYMVYNISVSEGTIVSDESIISASGLSKEQFYEKAQQVLGSHYWSGVDTSNKNFKSDSYVGSFNEQLKKTISKDNIDRSYLYINDENQLCIVAFEYSMAGSIGYWHDLNMVDFEFLPYYADEASKVVSETTSPSDINNEIKNYLGEYKSCAFSNNETGTKGELGLTLERHGDTVTIWFTCWIDGLSSSAEDFCFEYKNGVTRYSVIGNRNRTEYNLELEFMDDGVVVEIKRIADSYKIIPEGTYKFYR